MADPEIRFVGELQKLTIGPGDKFVLTVEDTISAETADRIRAYWHRFAGAETPVLILQKGMKLGAVNVTVEPVAED